MAVSLQHDVQSVYAPLLRQCSRLKALAEGKKIHSLLRQHGHDKQTFLANLLVQMYGRCGSLPEARSVFDGTHYRNRYSWNLIIGAYAQNGHLQEARRLFEEMPGEDMVAANCLVVAYARSGEVHSARQLFDGMSQRDVVSWNTIVSAYAQNGHMEEASALFELMPMKNVVTWNSMITGYAQNKRLQLARKIFQEMAERDVVSWTAMIVANAQEGMCSQAVKLFQEMDMEGVVPNMFTFTSVVDACGEARQSETGRAIHEEIISAGFHYELNVGNALVSMYCRFGEVKLAKQLFDGMPQRDVVSWTSMTATYAQHGDSTRSREMFEKSPQSDVVSWTSLIGSLSATGNVHEAENLFQSVPVRNVVTWNTMMSSYVRTGRGKEAIKLFKLMDLEGMQGDRVTCIILLEACTTNGSPAFGRLIYSLFLSCGTVHENDAEVGTCLVHLYGRCGKLQLAREVFDRMARGDVVPWNAILTAYAECGDFDSSVELLWLMLQEGVQPNEITSVSVLSACSRAGTLRDGRQYFRMFVSDLGVQPVIDSFICIMDLLGRAGLLEQVEDLVQNMPFEIDSTVLLAFLSSCKLHGDSVRASYIAEVMFMSGDRLSCAPYLLLSNSLSNALVLDRCLA